MHAPMIESSPFACWHEGCSTSDSSLPSTRRLCSTSHPRSECSRMGALALHAASDRRRSRERGRSHTPFARVDHGGSPCSEGRVRESPLSIAWPRSVCTGASGFAEDDGPFAPEPSSNHDSSVGVGARTEISISGVLHFASRILSLSDSLWQVAFVLIHAFPLRSTSSQRRESIGRLPNGAPRR